MSEKKIRPTPKSWVKTLEATLPAFEGVVSRMVHEHKDLSTRYLRVNEGAVSSAFGKKNPQAMATAIAWLAVALSKGQVNKGAAEKLLPTWAAAQVPDPVHCDQDLILRFGEEFISRMLANVASSTAKVDADAAAAGASTDAAAAGASTDAAPDAAPDAAAADAAAASSAAHLQRLLQAAIEDCSRLEAANVRLQADNVRLRGAIAKRKRVALARSEQVRALRTNQKTRAVRATKKAA